MYKLFLNFQKLFFCIFIHYNINISIYNQILQEKMDWNWEISFLKSSNHDSNNFLIILLCNSNNYIFCKYITFKKKIIKIEKQILHTLNVPYQFNFLNSLFPLQSSTIFCFLVYPVILSRLSYIPFSPWPHALFTCLRLLSVSNPCQPWILFI